MDTAVNDSPIKDLSEAFTSAYRDYQMAHPLRRPEKKKALLQVLDDVETAFRTAFPPLSGLPDTADADLRRAWSEEVAGRAWEIDKGLATIVAARRVMAKTGEPSENDAAVFMLFHRLLGKIATAMTSNPNPNRN